MNPKKISFKNVEHAKYIAYWKKAQDFYNSMSMAYGNKNWHSVGLESVRCAISATDALLVYKKGMRCSSQDHRDLADFLIDQFNNNDARKYSDTLVKIISMKNIIEYEDRIFTEKEASEIFKRTERYYNWVKSQIP
ncbi:MAG: hypothetical protein AUJ85_08215 [Elusimicrobia bacterium CG1_02_37_114]|nr:MAG: hypothetical protein AUJ85_08215 [Elusimicrobia bacterium CG1_02_37_114]PIV52335.1 MAG: hypothetical protein COS17_09765 [Elusimicrobia bacterium CG02_land_8_20_14_3_00_37_13]PIZ12585.1 MAG: hypothetical protein COY53_09315 [Elusimicrobia bacterium CG_4_10_14_0_8_um_filter_37_32]